MAQAVSQKPFNMITQLVKSQIYVEKLLRKHSIDEVQSNLEELMQKYEWIRQPPASGRNNAPQRISVKPRQFQCRIVLADDVQSSQVKDIKPPAARQAVGVSAAQNPVVSAIRAPVQRSERSDPAPPSSSVGESMGGSKFDPTQQRSDPSDDRAQCEFCGRRFAQDRLAKHSANCEKNPEKIRLAEQRKREVAKKVAGRAYE